MITVRPPEKFLLLESSMIPLFESQADDLPNNKRLLANMIDPSTGKPYEGGMILSGVFADLNPNPNNNNRIYDIPEYVALVGELYKRIFSKRGVYGEFEHPQKYATYGPNVSHKLLDIWYDESRKLVLGSVLVLGYGNGLIVQEIIRSGGQVCISARAAGTEVKQPDGTLKAVTKLLVTYDLVMNPGFTTAEMSYVSSPQEYLQVLNESANFRSVKPFSVFLYESQIKQFSESYNKYISLNENLQEGNYIEWFDKKVIKNLDESEQDLNKEQQEKLEDNDIPGEKKAQNQLEDATQEQLNESNYWQQANNSQQSYWEKLKKRGAGAVFDNSAGFINYDDINSEGNIEPESEVTDSSCVDVISESEEFFEALLQSTEKSIKSKEDKKIQKINKKADSEIKKVQDKYKPASKDSKDKSNQTYFSKQALKKNGRDYLNLDLDDGNGNAGKRILQKGVKDKDYSGKDDTKKEKKIDKINNKRDKKLSKIKPKQSTQKKQESFT